jgi:preprotein translocase subunit SecG
MNSLMYILMGFFVVICLILILLILVQKGRGGGLSGAFGGGGGGNTAFGAKTGDMLTWATSIIFGLFLLIAILLNLLANHAQSTQAAVMPVAPSAPISAQSTAAPPTTQPAATTANPLGLPSRATTQP